MNEDTQKKISKLSKDTGISEKGIKDMLLKKGLDVALEEGIVIKPSKTASNATLKKEAA